VSSSLLEKISKEEPLKMESAHLVEAPLRRYKSETLGQQSPSDAPIDQTMASDDISEEESTHCQSSGD
jgi:hypothetical protein